MTYNGYVADLFFNACAIVMWAAFLWRVLDGPRFRVWVTVLLAALIGAAYMAATLLLTTVGQLRALMFPVCSLAMAFLLFHGTPGRKLLAVAAELAGSLLMELMFSPLMIDLNMNDDISIWADPRALIYGVTFLPVLGLGLMLISFIFTRSKNNLSGRQLLVFSAFPITQMVCEASLVTLMFTPPRYEYIPMQLIVSVLFLVSDILLYRTMMRTEQRVQLEVENQLLEKQLDAQLAHYSDLTAQYEQIRAMRHDISHHLNTINALLQEGNLKAATEYSEQLLPMQTYISRLGKCQNPVVDAFLYSRMQDAEAKGMPVQADVSLPVELPVSNTDLIVAFGNLLDNALEACSGIPDAQITLRAHMDKGYLVIQESNPVRARQPQGKKPRRIPELERGVGFRVLSGLAQKYDGSFRHTCENDTYTVTLLLRAAAAGVPAVPAHV
ncbi:MAG TPA: GHKL domain-containing protein [Clostridiales bacterium]|nr:GHKL domain-containing protein [Clostridiales bacterium]